MDFLIRYGFSIDDIKTMMDTNIMIEGLDDENLSKIIDILEKCSINKKQIRNILVANPFYLNRNYEDINSLIEEISKLKINNFKGLFEANPFILNLDVLEFREIIKNLKKQGFDDLEINDYLKYEFI